MVESRPEWLGEIDGVGALFDWFGYWPDFHDAEIISLELNRRQNVIYGLKISRVDSGFHLELDPCYGLAGNLTAAKLRIQIQPSGNVSQ